LVDFPWQFSLKFRIYIHVTFTHDWANNVAVAIIVVVGLVNFPACRNPFTLPIDNRRVSTPRKEILEIGLGHIFMHSFDDAAHRNQ
jgi:hypothetical protein